MAPRRPGSGRTPGWTSPWPCWSSIPRGTPRRAPPRAAWERHSGWRACCASSNTRPAWPPRAANDRSTPAGCAPNSASPPRSANACHSRKLLADAVEEELEAVAEPLGRIGGKGGSGELVLDPVHGQLRLPGASLGQLELCLFFDGVAEHEVERGKGGPAGPFGR